MNKKTRFNLLLVMLLFTALLFFSCRTVFKEPAEEELASSIDEPVDSVELPLPEEVESLSLEEAFQQRRSDRDFSDQALTLEQVGRLLLAAQGHGSDVISGATRPVASAGATYPIEIYIVAGKVDGLSAGVYQYNLSEEKLVLAAEGDFRENLARAAYRQNFVASAPATIIVTAEYQRTTQRYGERGKRFVYMESGSAAQHIALQATALDLGNVIVGAFKDDKVQELLQINEAPMLLIPVGHRAE